MKINGMLLILRAHLKISNVSKRVRGKFKTHHCNLQYFIYLLYSVLLIDYNNSYKNVIFANSYFVSYHILFFLQCDPRTQASGAFWTALRASDA